MTNYARFETNSASLCTEFGETLARKHFGDIVDRMPVYVRGKKKGLLKGEVTWTKCTIGGWVKTGGYSDDYGACGYVATPGPVEWSLILAVDYDHRYGNSTYATIARKERGGEAYLVKGEYLREVVAE